MRRERSILEPSRKTTLCPLLCVKIIKENKEKDNTFESNFLKKKKLTCFLGAILMSRDIPKDIHYL